MKAIARSRNKINREKSMVCPRKGKKLLLTINQSSRQTSMSKDIVNCRTSITTQKCRSSVRETIVETEIEPI